MAACLVVGAGDGVGGAIAKAFAAEGYEVCITRRARNLEQLEDLAQSIRDNGGKARAYGVDARSEDEMIALVDKIEAEVGPLEVVVFNIGANVCFSLTDTTSRVFHKVWEMACFAGFLTGREAARVMIPRGRGTILFTGASASLRGRPGLLGVRRRQAWLASPGPVGRPRARSAGHPCRPRGRRRLHRWGLLARQHPRPGSTAGRRQHPQAGRDRQQLCLAAQATTLGLDARTRSASLDRDLVRNAP